MTLDSVYIQYLRYPHWGQQADGCDTLGLDSTGEGSATIARSFIRGGVQGEEERDHFLDAFRAATTRGVLSSERVRCVKH